MSEKGQQKIEKSLLDHINYLRSLHLEAPRLGNTFLEDRALLQYTNHIFGTLESTEKKYPEFHKQLVRLGDRFVQDYLPAARNAQENHPRLQQFDTYGRRIDKLHLSEGWKQQSKFASEDGIVALAYQQDKFKLGELQRFGQLIVLYMYQPSSGLYGCPLAMTDGAAYTIRNILESNKTSFQTKESLIEVYSNLISRNNMWTSGQWMTQKKGGSDVSNTETIAVKCQTSNKYKLYGYKWFTSATDSNMSLGLAKVLPLGMEPTINNIKNLKVSLFYIKMKKQTGELNNMEIVRLKDKLGTRQLPTAQLLLMGSQAQLISEEGQGVKTISKMLTITRIYNSSTAVGLMRRGIALAKDYSARRVIGKTRLNQMPLQQRVLSHLQVVHRGNLMLYIRLSQIFSRQQSKTITQHEANLLRVMVPLMKLYTGKQVLLVLTEVLQSFGGMGYIQGSMLPVLLRDAQVLSIWEGTTNVLCYDFIRALLKKQNSYKPIESFRYYFKTRFDSFKKIELDETRMTTVFETLITNYNNLFTDLNDAAQSNFKKKNHLSELRTYAFGLTRLYIAIQLTKHYLNTFKQTDFQIIRRWVDRGIYSKQGYDNYWDKEFSSETYNSEVHYGLNQDIRGINRSRL